MKNKHIQVVKKWIDDNDSVSQAERAENSDAAYAAFGAAAYGAYGDAYDAASNAAHGAFVGDADYAAFWIKRYEELTNDK